MAANESVPLVAIPDSTGVGGTGGNHTTGLTVSPAYSISLFLFGCFGNILALILLARSPKQQRQSAFYALVGGLAITDLVGTATTSQIPILVYSQAIVLYENTPLCDFYGFVMIFFGVATIHVLLFMSFERYLAFRHPYKYNRWINKKRAKIFCVVSWIGAGFFSAFPLMGFGSISLNFPRTWCFFNYYGATSAEAAYVYLYTLYGLLTFLAIVASNGIVVFELMKMRRKTKFISTIQKQQNGNSSTDSKDLDMIIVMVGVVVVQGACWLPLLVNVLFDQITLQKHIIADVMTIRIASLNQIIDPWIYIILRRDLFQKIKTFFFQVTSVLKLPNTKKKTVSENGGKDMIRLCSVERSEVDCSRAVDIGDIEATQSSPNLSPKKKCELKTSLLLEETNGTVADV